MTELPHTRTRMVHWLATAVALAAVVGASAFVQPSDASAGTTPSSSAPPADSAPPDPSRASFPMECGRGPAGKPEVTDKGTADFDGDGRTDTVAVVRCRVGMGTPPSGVYVLAPPEDEGKRPKVVATLVSIDEKMNVDDFSVHGRTVSATLLGYSSPRIPRCCPDRQRKVKWEWRQGRFALIPAPVAGSV